MCTPQACLPMHQIYSLCFPRAATLRALVACWFLILCHVKPKTSFWSTVLQLECERRAWQGGNRKINCRLLKLIWKLGNVLIHRLTFVSVAVLRRLCDIQGFTHCYQHCWSRFGKSRCWFVFVWAFWIKRTGESLGGCDDYSLFIGIVKKIKPTKNRGPRDTVVCRASLKMLYRNATVGVVAEIN